MFSRSYLCVASWYLVTHTLPINTFPQIYSLFRSKFNVIFSIFFFIPKNNFYFFMSTINLKKNRLHKNLNYFTIRGKLIIFLQILQICVIQLYYACYTWTMTLIFTNSFSYFTLAKYAKKYYPKYSHNIIIYKKYKTVNELFIRFFFSIYRRQNKVL